MQTDPATGKSVLFINRSRTLIVDLLAGATENWRDAWLLVLAHKLRRRTHKKQAIKTAMTRKFIADFCSPAACHSDVIAEKVREIVIVLREDLELKARSTS